MLSPTAPTRQRRFLDAAELVDAGVNGPLTRLREATLFSLYNATMGVEWLRRRAGAQPGTRDPPHELTDVDAEVRFRRSPQIATVLDSDWGATCLLYEMQHHA